MSRLPDLVLDSKIHTEFFESTITHSYLEIDDTGRRFTRTESWRREQFLGRGGFGEVRLEKCVTTGVKQGSVRAVKSIDKPRDTSGSMDYNKELEAIAKFSNDRYRRWFVKSFGWFEDSTAIFVTMEYCRHGDLQHYLRRKKSIPVAETQQLAHQMLEGLDRMHHNGFVHRDLKPGNVLIKSMPPDQKWWIVLADFGISKRADEHNGTISAVKGTTGFMAPELLGFLDRARHNYTVDSKAADMWALGEIIFRMLTGEAVFQNPGDLMTYCMGLREFPSTRLPMSAEHRINEFIANLMMALPQNRPNTTQCFQYCWMNTMVEVEFAALNFEESGLLATDVYSPESASAQWSSLSTPTYRPAQTRTQSRTLKIERTTGPPVKASRFNDIEAAALAILGEKIENGETLQITDCFVVCNAAETVDWMSYRINSLQPPNIEEMTIGDGENWGSIYLDEALEKCIKWIVGEDQWGNLKPRAKKYISRDLDIIKRQFTGDDKAFCVELLGVEDDPSNGIDDEVITLKPSIIKTVFDHVGNKVLRMIDDQIEQIEHRDGNVKAILFIGEVDVNCYMHQQLNRAYGMKGITIFRVVFIPPDGALEWELCEQFGKERLEKERFARQDQSVRLTAREQRLLIAEAQRARVASD